MLTFKQYCTFLTEHTNLGEYFHTSVDKMKKKPKENYPIWLSHSEHQARGWHQLAIENSGTAHTYSVKVNGVIAKNDDPKIQQLFSKNNIDQDDYDADLASNPDSDEVHSHEATKMLQKNGYVGYQHSDYDPHDQDNDHDSTVIFNRHHVELKHLYSN